jgi:hypothetical protein
MSDNPQILNDFEPEVRSLLHTLKAHGFTLRKVDNGEAVTLADDPQFVSEIIACDEAHLYVTAPDGKRATLFLVLGNSPGEVVCDYTATPALDAAVDEHYKRWDGRKQPTTTAN